jgi:hypothetical protein
MIIYRYYSSSTNNLLTLKEDCFVYKGKRYPGLVDIKAGALYDYPPDSFCEACGLPTSIAQKLIYKKEEEIVL